MNRFEYAGLTTPIIAVDEVVDAQVIKARLAEITKLKNSQGFKQGFYPPRGGSWESRLSQPLA